MKNLYVLLLATGASLAAVAQSPKTSYSKDAMLSRWVIDVNVLGGFSSQEFTSANSVPNYLNALNAQQGELKYKNGMAYGADAQVGFFFGRKRHFGIGAGLMYLMEQGDATLDKFHVEYQATDFAGSTFRQVMSGNDVRENLKITNINIPVVLKYKKRFSKRWGFTADVGALFNVQMSSAYTTHASFDYEALYQFKTNADGSKTAVYDNSPIANPDDWMITKAEFLRNNPQGNMAAYFDAKRALGYSVGLDQPAGTSKGTVEYSKGSVGLLLQPSFNYFMNDRVALNFGGYYLLQPFKNANDANYRLTNDAGNYSSSLKNVTASTSQSYGLNLGVRFFLGNNKPKTATTSTDPQNPTLCATCNGSIILHGLQANQVATVDYALNGVQQKSYKATVDTSGDLKINNLCEGNYSKIVAFVRGKKAMGTPVTLSDPRANISFQNVTNPTASGLCDGAVRFNGLPEGRAVSILYSRDGSVQPVFNAIVNSDNSVTISHLCEGKYSSVTATVNNCTAKGADFILVAPPLVAPVLPNVPAEGENKTRDISAPVLFESDRSYVPEAYYPEINDAAEELKDNKTYSLVIDGHADTTGLEAHNEGLSLKRANAVKAIIVQKGVDPARIKTQGHGSDIPVAPNETPEGRQQNRRSEMKLVKSRR